MQCHYKQRLRVPLLLRSEREGDKNIGDVNVGVEGPYRERGEPATSGEEQPPGEPRLTPQRVTPQRVTPQRLTPQRLTLPFWAHSIKHKTLPSDLLGYLLQRLAWKHHEFRDQIFLIYSWIPSATIAFGSMNDSVTFAC